MIVKSDFHVHTKASHCCKEHYGVVEAWNAAQERGIEHLGITDHDVPFKNGYLKSHENAVEGKQGLLLGLEVSIRDEQGRIQVSKRDLARLNYVLLAEHVHIMPTWMFLRKGRKGFVSWWQDPNKQHLIERYYQKHAIMTCNALERNNVNVLAHPWRFPWHQGMLDKASLDETEKVVQKAVKKDVRIEVSRVIISMVQRSLQNNQMQNDDLNALKPWKGKVEHALLPPGAFFKDYFTMCHQLGATFTLGSDAHKMADIGMFGEMDGFLNVTGLREKDIIQDIGK